MSPALKSRMRGVVRQSQVDIKRRVRRKAVAGVEGTVQGYGWRKGRVAMISMRTAGKCGVRRCAANQVFVRRRAPDRAGWRVQRVWIA